VKPRHVSIVASAEPILDTDDVACALEELLVTGGSLNRKLLGAAGRDGIGLKA
jgi:hypothetical protein